MATDTRIYLAAQKTVIEGERPHRRLIRAKHPVGVARHLANDWHIVSPSQDELIELAANGVKVETAADDNGAANPSTI